MTEQAEKYRAISELSALLRESTQKRLTIVKDEAGTFTPQAEYYNIVFSEQEHQDVKRALLKLCGEI